MRFTLSSIYFTISDKKLITQAKHAKTHINIIMISQNKTIINTLLEILIDFMCL